MRSRICVIVLLVIGGTPALWGGAQQTWTGIISDSLCRGNHGGEVDERECTQKCIENGDKYVLVTDYGEKVWEIANQNFPALRDHPGHTVKVTGELKGNAIVISRIDVPGRSVER
jgi:hypothetical protein